MKTSRAILNDRTKKKKSSFHKICTYENSTPRFESEEIHGYEFSHTRTPGQQLVFHKEEIRPTPISLPTPPASPEFWGTSLHKWYQKKPLFTLTAKGQVKRLEKYLQIQKTIEMCKKEHEFQVQTENMKKAYADFEFREHQPLLYDDKDVCSLCPCNSRKYDVDFVPVDYVSCSPSQSKVCTCQYEDDMSENIGFEMRQETEMKETRNGNKYQYPLMDTGFIEEEIARPTNIIKQGQKDANDRGIYKIIVKNKEMPEIADAKYMKRLYDNQNFEKGDTVEYMTGISKDIFYEMPNFKEEDFKSGLSKITVGNIASLPFDCRNNNKCTGRSPKSGYSSKKNCACCHHCHSDDVRDSSCFYTGNYDLNMNEIS